MADSRIPDIRVTSAALLESMELQVTIRVQPHVVWIVATRLWLACQIVKVAALVGGLSIVVSEGDEADA
jgi:hypothetical protein